MSTLPKTIFKYEGINDLSLQNLESQVIYFSSPLHFNDPYDCTITARVADPTAEELETMRRAWAERAEGRPIAKSQLEASSDDELRKLVLRVATEVFQTAKERFLRENGISCFSERNDHLLMWGHYGGRYSGYCLEFRTEYEPFNKLRIVKYVERIPKIDLLPLAVERNAEQIVDLYCTKSRAWEYEKEWRAIHKVAGTLFRYPPLALKAVYFGPRINQDDREKVCRALGGANRSVEYWQGKRSEEEFRIEFERYTYIPSIVMR